MLNVILGVMMFVNLMLYMGGLVPAHTLAVFFITLGLFISVNWCVAMVGHRGARARSGSRRNSRIKPSTSGVPLLRPLPLLHLPAMQLKGTTRSPPQRSAAPSPALLRGRLDATKRANAKPQRTEKPKGRVSSNANKSAPKSKTATDGSLPATASPAAPALDTETSGGTAVACCAAALLVGVWAAHIALMRHVEAYMDETLHVPQAERLCVAGWPLR